MDLRLEPDPRIRDLAYLLFLEELLGPEWVERWARERGKLDALREWRKVVRPTPFDAQAFTLAQDIIFGAEEYTPETGGGNKLLAHKLAHVIQQGVWPFSLKYRLARPDTRLFRPFPLGSCAWLCAVTDS
jgi:hypothetical protein